MVYESSSEDSSVEFVLPFTFDMDSGIESGHQAYGASTFPHEPSPWPQTGSPAAQRDLEDM